MHSAANIDHAPLRLGGFEAQHILGSTRDIVRKVAAHYVSQALRELYKVLCDVELVALHLGVNTGRGRWGSKDGCQGTSWADGRVFCFQVLLSFDVLGNPVGSFSSLGTGVRDFFVEPAQGMGRGVRDFGAGLGVCGSTLFLPSLSVVAFGRHASVRALVRPSPFGILLCVPPDFSPVLSTVAYVRNGAVNPRFPLLPSPLPLPHPSPHHLFLAPKRERERERESSGNMKASSGLSKT